MIQQATGITTLKKSEAIRPQAHATSSDCFAARASKLPAATVGENVNNQLVQEPVIQSTKNCYIRQLLTSRDAYGSPDMILKKFSLLGPVTWSQRGYEVFEKRPRKQKSFPNEPKLKTQSPLTLHITKISSLLILVQNCGSLVSKQTLHHMGTK